MEIPATEKRALSKQRSGSRVGGPAVQSALAAERGVKPHAFRGLTPPAAKAD